METNVNKEAIQALDEFKNVQNARRKGITSVQDETATLSEEELGQRGAAAMQQMEEATWRGAVTSNEFWFQDIPRSAVTTVKNAAANIVGSVSDMAGLALAMPAGGTMGIGMTPTMPYEDLDRQLLETDSMKFKPDMLTAVPGNSEQIAKFIGGDPEHLSMLATGLVTPGLGEFAGFAKLTGASVLGMGAVTSNKIGNLKEFLAKADSVPAYDKTLWKETGWYKGEDGEPRFYLSDANAKINMSRIENDSRVKGILKEALENNEGRVSKLTFRLGDILEHEQLYEAYPQLRNMKLNMNLGVQQDTPTVLEFVYPEGKHVKGSTSMFGKNIVDNITTKNNKNMDELMETVLHEVQHVIQQVEGFAQGGNPADVANSLNNYEFASVMTEVMDLIDLGDEAPDDLYNALMQAGAIDEAANELVTNPLTLRYMAAIRQGDTKTVTDLRAEVDGASANAKDNIGFILSYLYGSDELIPKGQELTNMMFETLEYQDVQALSHRAYENLYGEAEAVLTADLRKKTQAMIDSADAPPNPRFASSRTEDEIDSVDLFVDKPELKSKVKQLDGSIK